MGLRVEKWKVEELTAQKFDCIEKTVMGICRILMETSRTVNTPQLLCRLFTDFVKYFCGISFAFSWLSVFWSLNISCPSDNFLIQFGGQGTLNSHRVQRAILSSVFILTAAYLGLKLNSSLESSKFVSLMHANLIGSSSVFANTFPLPFWDKPTEEWAYACATLIPHHHMQDLCSLKHL